MKTVNARIIGIQSSALQGSNSLIISGGYAIENSYIVHTLQFTDMSRIQVNYQICLYSGGTCPCAQQMHGWYKKNQDSMLLT